MSDFNSVSDSAPAGSAIRGKLLLRLGAVSVACLMVSGCIGGTTYGTGVTQEEQTLTDITNMLTFQRNEKPKIDYQPRPDLVVPANKELVEPVDAVVTTSNPDWPESPEERRARIRKEADESQTTLRGEIQFANDQKVNRPAPSAAAKRAEAPVGQGVPNVSCDPDGVVMRRCTSQEIREAVLAARQKTSVKGYTGRRYLTEPPDEYRTPAQTAVAGDQGFTEEELKEARRREVEEARRLYDRRVGG